MKNRAINNSEEHRVLSQARCFGRNITSLTQQRLGTDSNMPKTKTCESHSAGKQTPTDIGTIDELPSSDTEYCYINNYT